MEVGSRWDRSVGLSFPVVGLVEVDLSLGRSVSGGEAWGTVGEAEMTEDALDDVGLGDEGE